MDNHFYRTKIFFLPSITHIQSYQQVMIKSVCINFLRWYLDNFTVLRIFDEFLITCLSQSRLLHNSNVSAPHLEKKKVLATFNFLTHKSIPSSSVKLGHHIFSNTAISIVNVLTKRRRKKKKKRVSCQSVNNLCILAQSLSQKNYYDVIIV